MSRAATLDDNATHFLYLIEQSDVVLVPWFATRTVLRFLQRVENTQLILVSDDLQRFSDCLERPVRYLSSYELLNDTSTSSLGCTYDCATHALHLTERIFSGAEFLVLDGVDDRALGSDFFLALLMKLRPRISSKVVIPLNSDYKVQEVYVSYFEHHGLRVGTLDILERPQIDKYFMKAIPTRVFAEMCSVVAKLFDTDKSIDPYDVLLLVPRRETQPLTQAIREDIQLRKHKFSLCTDISSYELKGSPRRLIITESSSYFLEVHHRIKYIVDSGHYDTTTTDPNGLRYINLRSPTQNDIHQHLSVLERENCKYFALFPEPDQHFYYGIHHTPLIHHILYTTPFPFQFQQLHFLKAPHLEDIADALDTLIQHQLIQMSDPSTYTPTQLAHRLSKFHIPPTSILTLFHSLLIADDPTRHHLIRLIALLLELGTHTVSTFIKDNELDHRLIVPTSDFLTCINFVNVCVFGDEPLQKLRNPLNQAQKLRVRKRYEEILGVLGGVKKGETDDERLEAAVACCGCFGVVSVGERVAIRPLREFRKDVEFEVVMRTRTEGYADGDLVLMWGSSPEMISEKKQRVYVDLVSKIPKLTALKACPPLKQV